MSESLKELRDFIAQNRGSLHPDDDVMVLLAEVERLEAENADLRSRLAFHESAERGRAVLEETAMKRAIKRGYGWTR